MVTKMNKIVELERRKYKLRINLRGRNGAQLAQRWKEIIP